MCYVGLVIILGIAYWLIQNGYHNNSSNSSLQPRPTTPSQQNVTTTPSETRIRVAAMGDMLAHDTIVANAKTANGYDFGKYFANIRSLYTDTDIVFCNQEGLSSGATYGITGYPAFNAPTEFASGLQSGAGCNLINLANNHMGDKGAAATNATVAEWESLQPLAYAGANRSEAEQNTVRYFTVKDIKFSFLAFADFNNNRATPAYNVNNYHDTALVNRLVQEARQKSDIVLVSMHWGTEDSAVPNSDQAQQVQQLAALGVDMVIGTGPHVLQPVAKVERPDGKQMTVWYSLGNMLSSQLNAPQLFSGIAHFNVVKNNESGQSTIDSLSFIPTYMHYEWTAAEQAQGNLLARTNVMIYPLSSAAEPLSKTRLNTTVEAQQAYIRSVLGPLVTVR